MLREDVKSKGKDKECTAQEELDKEIDEWLASIPNQDTKRQEGKNSLSFWPVAGRAPQPFGAVCLGVPFSRQE